MRRLGIFQMNDSDGIVDDYILFLLKDIRPNLSELVIVVNGTLQSTEEKKLFEYTNKIFYRKNEGFDAGAYKQVIIEYLGLKYIREFSELLIFNDTFFGPFYPFHFVFEKMGNKEVDFWGITLHGEYKRKGNYMPEHIQSYFLVIRREMLKSIYFEEFWRSLKDIKNFRQLVDEFETSFTVFFSNHGFRYAAYVEDDDLNSEPDHNYNHYAYIPYTLLDKYSMPILKRKDFSIRDTDELKKSIEWIDKNTDYDIGLIWKKIIRMYDVVELKNNLNFRYILPKYKLPENKSLGRAIVLAYLTDESQIERHMCYLQQRPKKVDLMILTSKKCIYDAMCKKRNQIQCMMIPDQGREFAFIIGGKNVINKYEYLCFVHDDYDYIQDEELSDMSLGCIVWENTLNSLEYIENVLFTLEQDKYLGVLSVPDPICFNYPKRCIDEWEKSYLKLEQLINQMHLNCVLHKKMKAFTFASAFWCKTDAIKKIVDYLFTNGDFTRESNKQYIKYLLIYAAQDAGYYSGVAETLEYAKKEIETQQFLISGYINYFQKRKEVESFSRNFKKIYIYGAGKVAKRVERILFECNLPIEGFAVTDARCSENQLIENQIIPISTVPNRNDVGIIVAMNVANIQEAKENLCERNYKNIFYMSE